MHRALIRTHHITSRKKVSKLKDAAKKHNVYALLRSGGVPGVMYVEGRDTDVQAWVDLVHELRYKDYQLVAAPSSCPEPEISKNEKRKSKGGDQDETWGLQEVETVKDFGHMMEEKGSLDWWREAMGFKSS